MSKIKRVMFRIMDQKTGDWFDEEIKTGDNGRGLLIRQGANRWYGIMGPHAFQSKNGDELFKAVDFLYPYWSWEVTVRMINGMQIKGGASIVDYL